MTLGSHTAQGDISAWNLDIRLAPHGRYEVKQRREGVDVRVFVPERVILATKCRKVLQSYYVPDEKRWMFLHHGEQPVAWMAWPEYPQGADGGAEIVMKHLNIAGA